MSTVTPIRPGGPTQPALPMHTHRIGPEVVRIHEVTSLLELVGGALEGISGDEDSLTIVESVSDLAAAVRSSRTLLMEIAERLQVIATEAEGGKSPS